MAKKKRPINTGLLKKFEPKLRSGVKLVHTLRVSRSWIGVVDWSPDGRILASPSRDGNVRVWDAKTGERQHTLRRHSSSANCVAFDSTGRTLASGSDNGLVKIGEPVTNQSLRTLSGHTGVVHHVAFDPSGRILASGSADKTINLWDTVTGRLLRTLAGHHGSVLSVAFDPSGRLLASGSYDNTIKLWDVTSGQVLNTLHGHGGSVSSVAFDPLGRRLATGGNDRTVKLWDLPSGRLLRTLEGHTGSKGINVAFLPRGDLLASKGDDGTVRLWHSENGDCLCLIEEHTQNERLPGLAFHRHLPLLATVGAEPAPRQLKTKTKKKNREGLRLIHIWELDIPLLLDQPGPIETSHYVNAKAVLLGDTGVGKSGLSLVLNNRPFEATESTAGRRVWVFGSEKVELEGHRQQTRETLLWDLAGQPGYRVIHQLHLNEVAVALVVFDARSETDPLAGVRHWERALHLAQQRQGASSLPMKKFLVSARTDRGTVAISRERLQALLKEFSFDGYFETSAKEGWGINELRSAIKEAIPWKSLPEVSSSKLFSDIKVFLLEVKKMRRLLAPVSQLYEDFARTYRIAVAEESNLKDQFETCIGRLENRDLIRQLSFGGYVLLQPELLDAYASAMVNAAKDEPDGLGSIPEDVALAGQFYVPREQKVTDRSHEQLLLHATVGELTRYDLALKESAAEGHYLVFPSQFNRDYEDAPEPKGKAVSITFDGPVQNLYATLAVRLAYSGLLTTSRREMWRNAAVFTAKAGGKCGLFLQEFAEARGRLFIFYDEHEGQLPTEQTKFDFEEFVLAHVQRRALDGTVNVVRFFVCDNCGDPVPDRYVNRLRERRLKVFQCPCGGEVSLEEPKERMHYVSKVVAMGQSADRQRDFEMFIASARGETSTPSFTAWAGDERVTLAIVFTDIVGSTQMAHELKDEGMNEVRRAHFNQSRKLLIRFNGREVKTIGDSLMAAFRSADSALDYALALQKNTGHPQVQIRAGIDVGPICIEEGDVFGGTVNFAARVVGAVKKAEIWLSDRAKTDIDMFGSAQHTPLKWKRHKDVPIKGFPGLFTFWSIAGRTIDAPMQAITSEKSEEKKLDVAAIEAATGLPALAVQRIVLENIRGFQRVDIQTSQDGRADRFVLLLGDNATGKTTLLRAIASAFCDETSAAALINPSALLRHDAEEGLIRVEFRRQPSAARIDEQPLWVENRFLRVPGGQVKLKQVVSAGFSRRRLFVAGYGPSRLSFGREQDAEYSSKAAVLTLFDRDASLMHPELVLRRITSTGIAWEDVAQRIDQVLHLPTGSVKLDQGGGMSIMAPHGFGQQFPFTEIGDGYLSTLNWVLDLCGSWMTFAKDLSLDEISGVVLLDELEQHLHPAWQREVVRALHQQFPNIQFIATTHSALCALGTTAVPEECRLIVLRGDEGVLECLSYSTPGAQNVNQLLTSPLFGLLSASSFGVVADIKRYSELKASPTRNLAEEEEMVALGKQLREILGPFDDEFHRDLEQLIRKVAVAELATHIEERGLDSEILGLEIRARLRELFDVGGKR